MMKLGIKLFLLFCLIIGLIILGISTGVINISKMKATGTAEQKTFLTDIKALDDFELIRENIKSVLEDTMSQEVSSALNIPSKGRMLALLSGEVSACINLKGVEQNDIKEGKDSIIIILPSPQLCFSKINFKESKIYDSNFNQHALNDDLIRKIFPEAENNIKAEAVREGILDKAKENAETIFSVLLKNKFKKEVTIAFKQ